MQFSIQLNEWWRNGCEIKCISKTLVLNRKFSFLIKFRAFTVCSFVFSSIIHSIPRQIWKRIFMTIIKFSFNWKWYQHVHLSIQFGVISCSHPWFFDNLCYLHITIDNIIDYTFYPKGRLFVWYLDAVFVTTDRATGYQHMNVCSWRPDMFEQLIRLYKINDTSTPSSLKFVLT